MASKGTGGALECSRREFLLATGGALVGLSALGLHSSRSDVPGLDAHRHNQNHVINATAAVYTGLTDIDSRGNVIPGIAGSWEPNRELTSWVFRLRKGALFHNGREVDAEAVKLNLLRIKDPAIGGDWERGAVENIDSVDVLDRYTLRLNARVPDASIPTSVMHYPTRLMAPDAFETAAEHPVGTGPFKFASWARWNETNLVRFENYWETDAEGHNLPYLDEIVDKPKREDSVRLTALRTGQVQLVGNMDQARRKELYTEAWNLVNTELPHFYLHEEVYTSAAAKALQGYQPSMMGALHYHGGGLRTAYMGA
jgi:ABC-type transport system substrate-binding protein